LTEPDALREQFLSRANEAGLAVSASVLDGCLRYLSLLTRWNGRMNLTALPLDPPIPDRTIDKLLIEPLCAADWFPASAATWLDLGSGGGSPAIPLRLACPSGSLFMVESRSRKCAFLREAVRQLDLPSTAVLMQRFEDLSSPAGADLITLRAVRVDADLLTMIRKWLAPYGRLLVFGGDPEAPGVQVLREKPLPDGSRLVEMTLANNSQFEQ
jgi:16S rRNA (guanine527-N7)-methyltransferase